MKDYILKESESDYEKSQRTSFGNTIADKDAAAKVIKWVLASDRSAIAEATSRAISTDLRDEISKIKCETLVIGTWKGKEKIGFTESNVVEKFKEQYKNLENKKIVIAENSKHFIMLDDPDWFNKTITGFISE